MPEHLLQTCLRPTQIVVDSKSEIDHFRGKAYIGVGVQRKSRVCISEHYYLSR